MTFCVVCDLPITPQELERGPHWTKDGRERHEACCTSCQEDHE